jgi:aerobic carbon-monoxide dehydrogenase large subunit
MTTDTGHSDTGHADEFHTEIETKHLEAAPRYEQRAGRFVGQKVVRKEDARLVTGHGRYVDDVVLPGMLHAHFVRSDLARARITSIDVSAALELDGVVAVLTGHDLHVPVGSMTASLMQAISPGGPGPKPDDLPLARDDVRYVGDPVAVIVATSRYLAEDAAELIEVDYEPLTPVVDYMAAQADGDRGDLVHTELGTNVASTMTIPADDHITGLLDGAAHTVTATFRQHRQTNVPMETRGIVASWDRFAGELTVHMSSQNPHEVRRRCADLLGLDPTKVRAVQQDVGGGFGQKMFMLREEIAVVLVAHRLGRTVKWIEDRRENLMAANVARIEQATVTFSLDADAKLLVAQCEHVDDVGSFGSGGTGAMVGMLITGPYRATRSRWSQTSLHTNTVGRAAYRGPWQMESVAREQMVDHVARTLDIDPLELRRRNVIHWEDLPYTNPMGMTYDIVTPSECLEQAATMIDYEGFRAEQRRAFEEDGRLLGLGIGLYVEPSAQNMATMHTEGATVRIGTSGSVDVYLGTGNHGQSIETTMAQLVADELGVDLDTVTVHQGDTSSTPFGAGTGGSRTANIVGGASVMAAREVRAKVCEVAAHLLEANPADLEITDGAIAVRGTPTRSVTIGAVAQAVHDGVAALPADLDVALEASVRYKHPEVTWSNACHMCTVEVDRDTGQVTIDRYIVSEDCGKMINPMVVEGQVAGGVVQGIAGVLYEHLLYNDDGVPLTTTFMDYLVPTAAEVPDIEYGHVETPSNTPGGYKGMGEGGAIGAPPCVFNAVADALALVGAEVFDQPLGPREVIDALESVGA